MRFTERAAYFASGAAITGTTVQAFNSGGWWWFLAVVAVAASLGARAYYTLQGMSGS